MARKLNRVITVLDERDPRGFVDRSKGRRETFDNLPHLAAILLTLSGKMPKDANRTDMTTQVTAIIPGWRDGVVQGSTGYTNCIYVLDNDGGSTVPFAEIVAKIHAAGLECFSYTTRRHGLINGETRSRHLIAVNRDITTREELEALHDWAATLIPGKVDRFKNLNHLFDIPLDDCEFDMKEGKALDLDALRAGRSSVTPTVEAEEEPDTVLVQGGPVEMKRHLYNLIGKFVDEIAATTEDRNNACASKAWTLGLAYQTALDNGCIESNAPDLDADDGTELLDPEEVFIATLCAAADCVFNERESTDKIKTRGTIRRQFGEGRKKAATAPFEGLGASEVTLNSEPTSEPAAPVAKPKLTPPLDALSPTIRDAVKEFLHETNASPEIAFAVALSMANLAVCGQWNAASFWSNAPIAICENFLVTVPSGGRKSAAFKAFTAGLVEHQNARKIVYNKERSEYDLLRKRYEKQLKKIEEDDSLDMDAARKRLQLLATQKPSPPRSWRLLTEKPSVSGMLRMLPSLPVLGLITDEAGEFLSGYQNRTAQQQTEGLAFLTKGWEGAPLGKDVGTEDSAYFADRRLMALLLVQPELVAPYLNDRTNRAQGGLWRFLIVDADRGEWAPVEEGYVFPALPHVDRFNKVLKGHLDRALPLNRHDDEDAFRLAPPTLNFAPNARNHLAAWWNSTILPILNGPETAIHGLYARVLEHAIRLAATLAAFEDKQEIELDDAANAVTLMDYFIAQRASQTYNEADLSHETRLTRIGDKLVERIEAANDNDWHDVRALKRKFLRDTDSDVLRKAADEMVFAGKLERRAKELKIKRKDPSFEYRRAS
jgi:hypothetical protein